MRSRAELLLRIVALTAIAAWATLAMMPRGSPAAGVSVIALPRELPRWTRHGLTAPLQLRIDSIPDATSLDWLSALRRAGTPVTWNGDPIPVAVEGFASGTPRGDIVVLAGAGSDAVLRDALGVLDTVERAAVIRLPEVDGDLTLRTGGTVARLPAPGAERRAPSAVLVLGSAGWEAKFIVAALEEAGWTVDARLSIAPGRDIVQGPTTVLDTSRHVAVVLLDSSAAETVRGVDAFVRAGGGVVLAGAASGARRVAPLVTWRAGARETAALGTLPGDTAWRGLSRVPLSLVSNDGAVALERRENAATVVVRRHHAGRVAAVGYDETWRWRMAGEGSAVADHREWWSRVVAGVAARRSPAEGAVTGAAPVARLHDMLGPPAVHPSDRSRIPHDAVARLLGLVALASLLSEWLLRRSRGAR